MENPIFMLPTIGLMFLAICSSLFAGYFVGTRETLNLDKESKVDTRIVDGSIFTIMGLLVAFTFSGANIRIDARRDLVIQEANSIMATYYSFSVFPLEQKEKAQLYLKNYTESRLKWSKLRYDRKKMQEEKKIYLDLQRKMWELALEVCSKATPPPGCQSVPASLINMFTLENKSVLYKHMHPPRIIHFMLSCIILLGSFLAGYNIKGGLRETWIHMLIFSIIMSLMLFVIFNLEFSRVGILSNVIYADFDNALIELERRLD